MARKLVVACRAIVIPAIWLASSGFASAQDMPAVTAPIETPASPAMPAAKASNGATVPPAQATPAQPAPAEAAQSASPQPSRQLSEAQLDQLLAPIALYPDPLLAQILMASTYPLEVVEAARWINAPTIKGLSGPALTNALQTQDWEPSIKALVPFPRVLQNLSNQLQWTQSLGDAFLARQADVMAAVQRLRHEAMAAGNLKQTPQCHCVIKTSGETISILPAEEQVVCVPVYNPGIAYGPWPYPAYPPLFFPFPPGFVFDAGFAVGFYPPIELALFGPFWGWSWFDWGHHDIAVDPGRFAAAAGGHASFSGNVWQHDPAHRGGVAYADPATSARFNTARLAAISAAARPNGTPAAAAHLGAAGRFGTVARYGAAGRSGAARRFGPAAHFSAAHFSGPRGGGGGFHRASGGKAAHMAVHGGGGPHGGGGGRRH